MCYNRFILYFERAFGMNAKTVVTCLNAWIIFFAHKLACNDVLFYLEGCRGCCKKCHYFIACGASPLQQKPVIE